MSKVKISKGDGDSVEGASAKPPKSATTQGQLSNRLMNGFTKEGVDPKATPKSFVAMMCNQNTRVGTLTGRVYLFPSDTPVFVHESDENSCAKHGAKTIDAKTIAALEQAKIDAEELAEFRKAKAAKADADAKAKTKK